MLYFKKVVDLIKKNMTKQDITWHHEPLTLEHKYGEANEWLQTIIITILYKGLKGTVINKKLILNLDFLKRSTINDYNR